MTVPGQRLVNIAQTQNGKPYVFGAEAQSMASRAWDCSELVEATCRAAGVSPTVPDGAWTPGRGNTGVRLMSDPTVTGYSAALTNASIGVTVDLSETGAWEQ